MTRVGGVDDTLRDRIRATLVDGVSKGESVNELRERLRSEFDLAGKRAVTIARTEVHGAVEESRNIGRKQAGIPLKGWLWSRKKEGRVLHQNTEAATRAKPIPADEEFTIAGTSIRCQHPGATGLPEHDINCGCTTLSRYPNDSLKAEIARHLENGFLTTEGLAALDARRIKSKEAEPCATH